MNKLHSAFSAALGLALILLLLPLFVWIGPAAIGAAIMTVGVVSALAFFYPRIVRFV